MTVSTHNTWLEVMGSPDPALAERMSAMVAQLAVTGDMPADEQARVSRLSTVLTQGAFVVSPERLELLRGLCQIYSAGIRAEKITSHRRVVGPIIVFCKKLIFRVVSALLGPTFSFQRDFNAGVIRLLGSLCNEDSGPRRPA